MGVSPSSAFFSPADHWIPILILILLILCLSPYNEILHINTIHSHFCYYCNLFHLFIYESLKYNGRHSSVEICHNAQGSGDAPSPLCTAISCVCRPSPSTDVYTFSPVLFTALWLHPLPLVSCGSTDPRRSLAEVAIEAWCSLAFILTAWNTFSGLAGHPQIHRPPMSVHCEKD